MVDGRVQREERMEEIQNIYGLPPLPPTSLARRSAIGERRPMIGGPGASKTIKNWIFGSFEHFDFFNFFVELL